MKKSQVIFFSILLILTIFLIGVIYYSDRKANFTIQNNNDQLNNQPSLSLNNNLDLNYQTALIKIFEDFLATKNFLETDSLTRNEALQNLEDNILNLVVPKEYKELHLNLIIALNKLKSQNPTEIELSRQIIEQQINLYPWLASTLSLILINYY